jgi:hypothetical protein
VENPPKVEQAASSDSLGLEEIGGEIAFAGIAKDYDDEFAAAQTAGDLKRRATVRTGGDADQYAFFTGQTP